MTPEEMQKTELVSPIGTVIKTLVGVVHLWKQTPGLCAGRSQAGKRDQGGTLLERPVEISQRTGGYSLQSTAHSYNENCVHTKKSPASKERGKRRLGTNIGPRGKGSCLRFSGNDTAAPLWLHGHQELKQACEELGALWNAS